MFVGPCFGRYDKAPVSIDLNRAVIPDQATRRGQLANRAVDAQRVRDVPQREVGVERLEIHLVGDIGISHDRVQLRGERQRSISLGIEQRLLAQAVTCEHEPPPPAVPHGKAEHPMQIVDELGPLLLVEVDDHLGVRARWRTCALDVRGPSEARGSCRSRRSVRPSPCRPRCEMGWSPVTRSITRRRWIPRPIPGAR